MKFFLALLLITVFSSAHAMEVWEGGRPSSKGEDFETLEQSFESINKYVPPSVTAPDSLNQAQGASQPGAQIFLNVAKLHVRMSYKTKEYMTENSDEEHERKLKSKLLKEFNLMLKKNNIEKHKLLTLAYNESQINTRKIGDSATDARTIYKTSYNSIVYVSFLTSSPVLNRDYVKSVQIDQIRKDLMVFVGGIGNYFEFGSDLGNAFDSVDIYKSALEKYDEIEFSLSNRNRINITYLFYSPDSGSGLFTFKYSTPYISAEQLAKLATPKVGLCKKVMSLVGINL